MKNHIYFNKKNSGKDMLLHITAGVYFYNIPKSSICSFHEYGKVVSSLVSDSVHGAFPAKMASTIGGASKASRRKRLTYEV